MNFNNTNWNLYKCFVVAFETGNLHRAAEIMFISRTAIGQNIKELERQLGVTLFTPNHRGVTPTAEAVNLYAVIKNATASIIGAENDLHAFTSESAGVIKIAIPDPVADVFIADYLKEFCAKYPKVRFDIFRRKGVDLLLTQNIDFVIDVDYKFTDTGLHTVNLFSLNDAFIASKEFLRKHGLTQNISQKQLLTLPLVTFASEQWLNFYKKIDPNAEPLVFTSDSSSMVCLLVKNSLGIGWLSKEQLLFSNDRNLVEVQVEGFPFADFQKVKIVCAYKTLSRPAKAFLDGLVRFCKR